MIFRFDQFPIVRLRSIFILLSFIFMTGVSNSYSQSVQKGDSDVNYWVEGGPSLTTLGTGLQAGLMADYNNHLFSISTTSTDFDFGAETWDIALIYGRSMSYRAFYLSAGTGVAVIGGSGYSDLLGKGTKKSVDTSIGFPLRGQLSWQPISFMALGIYGFANVNTEQPFGGIGFSLRVGQFEGL
ncbi:hypothetical protein [Fodinibius sp. Rm-B-1B1-1]|uniref:hypothetical protein n=1 Tax=Fodinibius alkaliphilus TaxID=3140241 RepID=UPI00315A2FF0